MLRKQLWLLLILCQSLLVSGCTLHYKEIIIREVDTMKKTKEVVKEVVSQEVNDMFPSTIEAEKIAVDELVMTKQEVNENTGEIKRVVFDFDEIKDLITRAVKNSRDVATSKADMYLKPLNRKEPAQLSSVPPALPLNVGKPLSLKETLLRFGGNLKDQLTTLSQMPGALNNTPESDEIYDFTGVAYENKVMQEMNPYFVNEETQMTMQEQVNKMYQEKMATIDDTLGKFSPEQIKEMISHYEGLKASPQPVGNSAGDTGGTQPEPQA